MHSIPELNERWITVDDIDDKPVEFKVRPLNDSEWDTLNVAVHKAQAEGKPTPELETCREVFNAAVLDWKGLSAPYSEEAKKGLLPTYTANRVHLVKVLAAKLYMEGFLSGEERKN